jgi:hypothetical protein
LVPLRLGWIFLILSLFSLPVFADIQDMPKEFSQEFIDELFKPVEQPWAAQGVLEFPSYAFYLGAPAVHGQSYQPNLAPRLGARVLWKKIGTTATFSLPIPKNEQTRRGGTSQTNILLNSYWRQNAFDFYYQKFRGFYVSSPTTELSTQKAGRYPQLPDAHVSNIGMNWYYAWNPSSYSLKAAFNQTEFQLKSGGSWLYTPFYNHLSMDLGGVLIKGSDPNSVSALPNLSSGHFDTFGMGVGYGHTWVRNGYFGNVQLALSPGIQWQHLQRTDGNDTTLWSLAGKANLNCSVGYNYDKYVGGVKLLVDSLYSRVADTQVWSNLISAQAFFGARF